MSQEIAVTQVRPKSVLLDMASRFNMEPKNFEATLKATVVPANVSNEQFAAFLLVAKEYNLNPLTKEIYAFPAKTGGIQPIVGIDGWVRITNEHPKFDGMTFQDNFKGNELVSITCSIHRKDRDKPTTVTEYLSECKGTSEPWKRWPVRMLRHKALIQCARYAFGFSGIIDPDEAERMKDVTPVRDNTPLKEAFMSVEETPIEEPQNKLEEILSKPKSEFKSKEMQMEFSAVSLAERKAQEIMEEVQKCTSLKKLKELVTSNEGHITVMDDNLQQVVNATIEAKKTTLGESDVSK